MPDRDIEEMDRKLEEEAAAILGTPGEPPVEAEPGPVAEPPVPEPVAVPVAEPDPVVEQAPAQPESTPEPGALSRFAEAPVATQESEPVEKVPREDTMEYWRDRCNSDLPKVHKWVEDRDAQIRQLREELTVSQRQSAELQARSTTPLSEAEWQERGVDADGLDSMGGLDTANRIRQVAAREAEKRLEGIPKDDSLTTTVEALQAEVAALRTSAETAQLAQFHGALVREHAELDSPEFDAWLSQVPTRAKRFEAAFQAQDTESMLSDYSLYQHSGPVAPPSLESQVMPGSSATPSILGADQKPKQYTIADVEALQVQWERTHQQLDDEQRRALAAEIDTAEQSVIASRNS